MLPCCIYTAKNKGNPFNQFNFKVESYEPLFPQVNHIENLRNVI